MRSKIKLLFLLSILLITASVWIAKRTSADQAEFDLDMVEVNEIVKQIENEWPNAKNGKIPISKINYKFVPSNENINAYIINRDTMADIWIDGKLLGKIVVFNEAEQKVRQIKAELSRIFIFAVVLFLFSCMLYAFYLYRKVIRPFRKLERFAAMVAQGNLAIPLEMDKKNQFGAFTESFDMMREQLMLARENERLADISKKELVASLSHDIKTPVSSIKAIAELYQAKHQGAVEMTTIMEKADQINLLISNMFTSTLKDLNQLKVVPEDVLSKELKAWIISSDYQKRILPFTLPDCIVTADPLRIRQVFDNIIENSYKYADTDILVSSCIVESFLEIKIKDFGLGVNHNEIALLSEKFYRAGNAQGKNGSGLGLYLTKYFLTEMSGSLRFESSEGLTVIICLKI